MLGGGVAHSFGVSWDAEFIQRVEIHQWAHTQSIFHVISKKKKSKNLRFSKLPFICSLLNISVFKVIICPPKISLIFIVHWDFPNTAASRHSIVVLKYSCHSIFQWLHFCAKNIHSRGQHLHKQEQNCFGCSGFQSGTLSDDSRHLSVWSLRNSPGKKRNQT